MINKQSALSAVPLAMLADSKGVIITPVAGTPLADLVNMTNNAVSVLNSGYVESMSPGEELSANAAMLEVATTGSGGTLSTHDRSIDCYVPELAKAVASHISFAKNIVAPVVLQMADEVKKTIDYTAPASSEFCISVVDLPAPMQNNTFEESVSKYTGKTLFKPERDLTLGEQTAEGILELIKTGSKVNDADIEIWYAGISADIVMCVWNNVFRDFKVSSPSVVKDVVEICKDTTTGIDSSLLIFLIARKLYDEVPDNTGMTLAVYKDVVSQLRDYSGTMLGNEYIRYNASVRNGTLIINTSTTKKHINVNGAVYREWLKTGGSNEVILGMIVSNTPFYSCALIDKESARFLAAWNTYEQYSNTASRNNNFNKFKQALRICFANGFSNLTDVEKDLKEEKPDMFGKINEFFTEELDKIRTSDMLDIHSECLKLVCRSRFYYTDAEKILQGINDAVKMNPSINIRDAAAMATCEYVFDYVSDQMRVAG